MANNGQQKGEMLWRLLPAAGVLFMLWIARLLYVPTWLIIVTAVAMALVGLLWNWSTATKSRRGFFALAIVSYLFFGLVVLYQNRLYVISLKPESYQRVFSLQPPVLLVYKTIRIRMSRSGDWGTRLRVQLTDGDTDDLRQLSPSNLRLSRTGHLEVVADVLAYSFDAVNGPVTFRRVAPKMGRAKRAVGL